MKANLNKDNAMQVNVLFSREFRSLLQGFPRKPVYINGTGHVQVKCDLSVGALAIDTPEAAATYSAMSRFHHAGGSGATNRDNAGCIICMTPPAEYGTKKSDLPARHSSVRLSARMENIRTESQQARLRAGTRHQHLLITQMDHPAQA